MNDIVFKRIVFLLIPLLCLGMNVYGQTQYDYYDDTAVAGGVDRALNGIIIIIVLIVVAIVLLFVINGILKGYYLFNPKADPDYKRTMATKEQARKHEEYVQKQREKAIPYAIDIGLSVKWASFNLGAYTPSDVGSLFYWAENQPSTVGQPKYSTVKVDVIGDIAGDGKYDAATNIWGKNWRLPTVKECQELLDYCKWETEVIDGIEGRLVTGPNGNSIFMPFNQKNFTTGKYVSGHYWTSSPRHGSESANDLRFGENCSQPAEIWSASAFRCLYCIRPVFSTISREMIYKQKETETKKGYIQMQTNTSCLSDTNIDYTYFQERCMIREEEKDGLSFVEDKIQRDNHGIIYSLDGKRLLKGNNCECQIYRIKEGTEFICNNAFSINPIETFFNPRKNTLKKLLFLLRFFIYQFPPFLKTVR